MSFPARYTTPCDDCDVLIQPEDHIAFNDSGEVVHALCPRPAGVVRPGEVSCTTCFLIHPIGACDR